MLTTHHGHCLDVLRTLPAQSVHCVVTSPPYWGLRDYQTPPVKWEPVTFAPMPGLPEMTVPAWEGHLGLEPDLWMFVAHIVAIFREVRRVLRDDGTCWMNFGDSYNAQQGTQRLDESIHCTRGGAKKVKSVAYDLKRPQPLGLKPKDLCGIPWRVAFALQADGWWLRSDIIWHKPNPMPESVTDRPTKAHEYLFLLTKGERYFYDAEAIKEAVSGTANPRGNGVNPKANGPNSRIVKELTPDGLTNNPNASIHNVRPKQNDSFSAAVAGLVDSRNKRSVWTVASEPYPEAHFATYPPALIRPCIRAGTSARGCCPKCGAPWKRVVETEKIIHSGDGQHVPGAQQVKEGAEVKGYTAPSKWSTRTTTTGWNPTCDCHGFAGLHLEPIPCTVLDPFGGSGTTGQVALEEGQHAILIELGAHHLPLIEKRCAITPGLKLA